MKLTEAEKLKKELEDLRKSNQDSWNTYGSELSAGDMSNREKILEDKIKELGEKY